MGYNFKTKKFIGEPMAAHYGNTNPKIFNSFPDIDVENISIAIDGEECDGTGELYTTICCLNLNSPLLCNLKDTD